MTIGKRMRPDHEQRENKTIMCLGGCADAPDRFYAGLYVLLDEPVAGGEVADGAVQVDEGCVLEDAGEGGGMGFAGEVGGRDGVGFGGVEMGR